MISEFVGTQRLNDGDGGISVPSVARFLEVGKSRSERGHHQGGLLHLYEKTDTQGGRFQPSLT